MELYQPFFKNIVFYSSKPIQVHQYSNLYFSDTRGGHSGYKALMDFCDTQQKMQDTDGILYIMDDVLVNIEYLKRLDLSRPVYFSQTDQEVLNHSKHLDEYTDTEHWGVWLKDTGRASCRRVVSDKDNTLFKEIDFFTKLSDFFYLPNACITEELIKYLRIFEKNFLHLEIAIPSLFKKLFYEKYGIQQFNALPNILGGTADISRYSTENFKKHIYEPNLYVHRVKVSTPENQQYVRELLK